MESSGSIINQTSSVLSQYWHEGIVQNMLGLAQDVNWGRLLTGSLGFLGALFSVQGIISPSTRTAPANILQDLGSVLSPKAVIVLPGSPEFDRLSYRWIKVDSPTYSVIVVPATEKDVSESVKYANKHDLPFLATTGGHGSWKGLNKMQGGMNIYMRNLTKFEISKDGKSATLGGGLLNYDVHFGLWEKGKQTVTGQCECVSLVSPGLGGGHGLLQGQYGLPGDQVLSYRVVLASGEVVTVSEHSHKDLFWAMRGAGHNFGIVTETKVKIYDVTKPEWSYQYFTFTHDKVKEVYRVANEMVKTQPAEITHWSFWTLNPVVDPTNVSHPIHPFLSRSLLINCVIANHNLQLPRERPPRHPNRLR